MSKRLKSKSELGVRKAQQATRFTKNSSTNITNKLRQIAFTVAGVSLSWKSAKRNAANSLIGIYFSKHGGVSAHKKRISVVRQ